MDAVYDEIGHSYSVTRQPDARMAQAIRRALGGARTVLNVGAGTGSYEPADLQVMAVEPSRAMIQQRPAGAAPVVQAVAEHLPWADAAFDATLAILTIHHWHNRAAGLAEMRRVARHRVVLLTWDPACGDAFWLINQYIPEILALDVPRFPSMAELSHCLGQLEVRPVPIPHDCQDGFLGAFWRRPNPTSTPTCGVLYQALHNCLPRSSRLRMAHLARTYAQDNGTPDSAGCARALVSISAIG